MQHVRELRQGNVWLQASATCRCCSGWPGLLANVEFLSDSSCELFVATLLLNLLETIRKRILGGVRITHCLGLLLLCLCIAVVRYLRF